MFAPGDYVVYSVEGVCRVEEAGALNVPGLARGREYYRLTPYYRGGVIYTVDTLAALQSKMPDCSLTYLIGADTLRALGTWRRVETVIERCKFLVMMREGETREDVIRLAGLWASRGAQIDFLDARKMDISSTQIREYIRKNQPFERLVPEAVADYIRARGLYGAKSGMELNG